MVLLNGMMATKIVSKAPFFYRSAYYSRKPTSKFVANAAVRAIKIDRVGGGFRSYCSSISPISKAYVFNELGRPQIQSKKIGFYNFRVFSVSNGGPGGGNGGFGGSGGGGNSGDNAGGTGDGGEKLSFLSWYLFLLQKYPVITKAITSAILTFIGDVICQVASHRECTFLNFPRTIIELLVVTSFLIVPKSIHVKLAIDQLPSLDWKRTFIFTLVGLVLVGPTLHFWYLYLSKLITTPGALGAFKRLLLDQFLFAPVFIGVVLSTLVTLEGKPQQAIPKLQQEWLSSVLVNWQLWVPFQFLNFRFVPQQFQVLAANFVALIWNVILSYKAHKEVVVK